MATIKQLVHKYAENFTYFYRYLRYRVFVVVGLSMLVGILDGFGLTMFLPMLQMVNAESEVNPESLGKLRFIVDGMSAMGIPITLVAILIFLCLFFLLKGVARFFSDAYTVYAQQYFIRKIRTSTLRLLNKLSFKKFITADIGRIQNTMSGEVDRVSRAFASYFKAFEQFVLAAVYMGFAFFVDVQFAVLVTFGGLITNFIYRAINTKTKVASRQLTKDANEFQSLIIQHVANFKYLKATGKLSLFGKRLSNKLQQLERSNKRIGVLGALITGAREPLLIFVVSAVILVQIKVLGASLGPILISLLFFYRALTALLIMQSAWNYFLAASGSMENMTGFKKELEANSEPEGSIQIPGFSSAIDLKNVSVCYGDKKVLDDISITLQKNETIAFAGESGSGKSTLVNLIAGLMSADSGTIQIDGIDRSTINIQSFQKRIGYITQEPVIFNDTIFNNITLWSEPTPQNVSRFNESLHKAALSDFIQTLPEKEQTLLGNNGINISGGQKQRISIARELYKDIDILIMDEATSSLDSETEKTIQDKIDELKGQYTILIVAHRLSTIKNADRIVLMKNGQIEQAGTYQQLMQNAALFKRMVTLQEL
ncbi:MAG TPA: ABC transporter ATP-binding protein [Ferruginibacter sp.]|nr:ABC transporter ATP-binding protein [Ferruginibacter sp.]HMP19666.1 ABC transporter ATP-binding protein [Ferruginibacter sp.]